MKKYVFSLGLMLCYLPIFAQSGYLDAILIKLEQQADLNKNVGNYDLNNKVFYLEKTFEDHTERQVLEIHDNNVKLIEIFDDIKTGQSSSNIYTGDVIHKKNAVSVRVDKLEGKAMPIPKTYLFMLRNVQFIWYLFDSGSKDRWIENASLQKLKKQQ